MLSTENYNNLFRLVEVIIRNISNSFVSNTVKMALSIVMHVIIITELWNTDNM